MNNKRRRTAIWLLAVALIVAVLIYRFSRPRTNAAAPVVNVAFLGYTNSGRGNEALFAFTNPPPVAVSVYSVRSVLPLGQSGKSRGDFSWGAREPWGLRYAIWVDTTNEPLRVVLQFQQRATGRKRLIEQVRELIGKLTHHEGEFFTGPTFYVTNETRIIGTQQ